MEINFDTHTAMANYRLKRHSLSRLSYKDRRVGETSRNITDIRGSIFAASRKKVPLPKTKTVFLSPIQTPTCSRA